MVVVYDNLIYNLQRAGGISTYWSELSKRFIRDNSRIYFIETKNDNIARKAININDNLILSGHWPIGINRFLPVSLPSFKNDFIFHSSYNRTTNNKNARQIVTVHDFIHEKFYKGARRMIHSYQKNKSIKSASNIIAVSENTKKDLLDIHEKINPANVHVIYNGVSDDFYRLNNYEIRQRPYFVFVGSRESYKNFNFVVKLVKELNEFDLYIVGKQLNKQETQLLSKSIDGKFKLFQNISNFDLNIIYNQAFALLYPSSYEGFGIPLLEAMKAGLPFIALNKSSIPEVAGNAGELVDELDIDIFKQAVKRIDSARQNYVSKGLERVKFFSWEKCYGETLAVYNNLLNK